MIHTKYVILLCIVMLTIAWACKPAVTASNAAADIAEALDNNDINLAKERANALDAHFNQAEATVPELCGLSIELMRLSDADNAYAAQALQYYQAAVARDSVAASKYYEKLPNEKFGYLQMLRQLRRQIITRESGITVSEDEEYGDEE